jgi:hypothetical protein
MADITKLNNKHMSLRKREQLRSVAVVAFAKLWNRGKGTAEISSETGVKEAEVYNMLDALKAVARVTKDD